MSTTGRTTQRGGKNTKTETNAAVKTQKPEVKMDSTKSLPTAEQMRIAQIIGTKNEDPALRNKIKQVMDATRKSEDEVCTALHDCDNDANRAVNYLLEGDEKKNEWLTSGKKKKNRTASTSKTDAQTNNHVSSGGEGEDWDATQAGEVGGGASRGRGGGGQDRERPRQRGGGPPRMRGRGSLENRGWRGRENKENERNLEEGGGGFGGGGRRERGGGRMSNGPMRSGRGGRGRIGARTFQNKDKNSNQKFPCTIETWNNPSTEDTNDKVDFPSPEDWDNEEYTGSLADSKVFTPSAGPEQPPAEDAEASLKTGHIADTQEQTHPTHSTLSQPSQLSSSPVGVNTLTPAQSQYLSQFTQCNEFKNVLNSVSSSSQATSTQAYPTVFTPPSVTCTSNFSPTVNIYTSSHPELNSVPSQTITARSKPQRPRVPPPSKIPSSAVEMPPGDAVNSGIGFIDVQFGGALEFGSGDTMENSVESSTPTPVPVTTPAPVPAPTVSTPAVSAMDAYVTSTGQQTTLASALNQSQKLSSGDTLIQSEPVVSSSYGTSSVRSGTVVSGTTTNLSELTPVTSKAADVSSLSYSTVTEPTSIYPTGSAYQKSTAPVYQTPVSTYNSSSYSATQVTSSSSTYNTSQVGGYASAGTGYTTSVNSAATTPSVNAYPNTNSYSGTQQTTGASYPYATYPATGSTGAGYQSATQAYPPQSVSVYGTTYPYHSNYNSTNQPVVSTQQSHKISGATLNSTTKDSQYEAVPATNVMTATVSSIAPVTTASTTPSLGLSGSSQTVVAVPTSSTKVASIPAVSKSGVVQSIPPGVPPMLGTQYIMSQTGGLQYYQQPMFGYEDAATIQVIPQRLPPHVPGGYFDMSGFQPPTSLATGRDGLGNVAYSMPADVRFTRSDNNTSPVPSTLSQQSATQAAHQQPILNPGIPPYATYAFSGGYMFPGNFQYGPPMYAPVAPTATASGHGNSTSAQYAKGPGGYSSAAYGSGYETGSTADYTTVKVGTGGTGYTATAAQSKTGTGVGTPTGTNPSATSDLMYNKSHGTLGKVNSYEKQGFHSGTPPPFNMTGSQNTGIAPTNVYTPQLIFPGMPHQQHHSTTMMHQQPMHQMEMRNQGRRTDGGTGSGARSQTSTQQNKSGAKQNYSPSYWNAN